MSGYEQLGSRLSNVQYDEVSKAFFSEENMEILQKILRKEIYVLMKRQIGPQSKEHLINIMHYAYKENDTSRLNISSRDRLNFLNKKVLEIIIPMVVDGIRSYQGYVRDASKLYEPMERGKATTSKGEVSLSLTNI